MRDEDHFVPRNIMENAIVILADAIAIPMDEEGFGGGKVDEAFDIEKLFEPVEAFDELFIGALDEHEQAEVAAIDADEGVTGARCWDAERVEEVAGKLLAKVTGVLDGIVEMDFGPAVKALAGSELVEIDGEGRFGIDGLEGKGAFEMKGDVCVNGVALVNSNGNVDALRPWLFPDLVVFLQDSHAFGRNVDAEAGNGAGRKEVISGLGSGKGGLGQAPESEED